MQKQILLIQKIRLIRVQTKSTQRSNQWFRIWALPAAGLSVPSPRFANTQNHRTLWAFHFYP
jgi:hypothetical protein